MHDGCREGLSTTKLRSNLGAHWAVDIGLRWWQEKFGPGREADVAASRWMGWIDRWMAVGSRVESCDDVVLADGSVLAT